MFRVRWLFIYEFIIPRRWRHLNQKTAGTPYSFTMTPKEIMAKLDHSIEKFGPIARQPLDSDLTRIREVVAYLLLQTPHDETGAVHNLIGLIQLEAAYIRNPRGSEHTIPPSTTTLRTSSARAQKLRINISTPAALLTRQRGNRRPS